MDPLRIARIAHEADRTLAALSGDMTVPGWPRLEPWQRTSQLAGVAVALQTPDASAEQLHESWRRDKVGAGWKSGSALDVAAKVDPQIMPWARLSELQRQRDELFLAIVRSLSSRS